MRRHVILFVSSALIICVGNANLIAQERPILAAPDRDLQRAADDAQAGVKQAAFALDLANKSLKVIQDRLEDKFKHTPEWTAASGHLDACKSALSNATLAAMASLSSNPDYSAAQAELDDAQARLDNAKADGDGPAVIMPLATDRLKAASKVTKLKNDCVDKDPDVISAKAALSAAQSTVDQLHAAFISSLSNSPESNGASKTADDDKALWVEAKAKLDAATELLDQDKAAKQQTYDGQMQRYRDAQKQAAQERYR